MNVNLVFDIITIIVFVIVIIVINNQKKKYDTLKYIFDNKCIELNNCNKKINLLQEIISKKDELINVYIKEVDLNNSMIETYKLAVSEYETEIKSLKKVIRQQNEDNSTLYSKLKYEVDIENQLNTLKEENINLHELINKSKKVKVVKTK